MEHGHADKRFLSHNAYLVFVAIRVGTLIVETDAFAAHHVLKILVLQLHTLESTKDKELGRQNFFVKSPFHGSKLGSGNFFYEMVKRKEKKKQVRQPGVEPGSIAWKATMLAITPLTLVEGHTRNEHLQHRQETSDTLSS